MKSICYIALGLGLSQGFCSAELVLAGSICAEDLEPVSGLTVSISGASGSWHTVTAEDGTFAFSVPEETGSTVVSIDPFALSEGGFEPISDFIWEPEVTPVIPVIELTELVPELSFERMEDGRNCITLNFDWAVGAAPVTLRNYCIERSHDMVRWTPVMNVGIACPPIEFFDETQEGQPACYYRVTELDPFFMPEVPNTDWGFIADPAIGWEGDPILLFLQGQEPTWEFQADVPIIAPEIRLLPASGE